MTRPLVLVHGFMGGRAQWPPQRRTLGDQREVVPVALPGFGDRNSEAPQTTIAGLARSVLADLDQMGIRQFDLLGHSMGGMVVQEVMKSAQDRVERLVLYGTGAVGALPGRFETIAESKARARTEGLAATARRIAATWFLDRDRATEFDACARIAEMTSQAAFDAGLDAMQDWSGEANLKAIVTPTLVLWGDGDRTYPWSQTQMLWHGIEQSRLAVVPGCAHAVHLEKPDLFNAIIADFLKAR
ncbi:MAG: alpha/beta hydrolase [Pseudomonadota bacterium]